MKQLIIIVVASSSIVHGFSIFNRTLSEKKVTLRDSSNATMSQANIKPKASRSLTLSSPAQSLDVTLQWNKYFPRKSAELIAKPSKFDPSLFSRRPFKAVGLPVDIQAMKVEKKISPASYEKGLITNTYALIIHEPQLDKPALLLLGPWLKRVAAQQAVALQKKARNS